jgi:hypothetical protein
MDEKEDRTMNNLKEAMKDDAPGHLYPFFLAEGC